MSSPSPSPRGSATMIALLVATMTALVEPHMIMATPKPYGYGIIDNSPLTLTNYPCKVTSDPATFYKTEGIIDANTMVAGENQTLSFKGSAVHGGGSCQLALTSDMQPNEETSWRVFLSIESGCPTKDGTNPSTYDFAIPEDVTPGQYSLAWTWISKLAGQPEYYMNCAPITVTAPKTKRDEAVSNDLLPRDNSWPQLFVGNLADINSCKSTPGTDPEYPDPGPNVEKLLEKTPNFAPISGTNCVPKNQQATNGPLPVATAGVAGGAAAGTAAASASSSASATAAASSPSSSAADQQSSSPAAASPSQGGVFAPTGSGTGAGSAPSPTTLATSSTSPSQASSVYVIPVTPSSNGSAAASPSATSAASSSLAETTPASSSATASASSATQATPSATLSPTGGGGGSGSGSGNSTGSAGGSSSGKTGPCTDEGMFNCVGTQYQQCASGAWTEMRALPGGTTCQQGESQNLWARDAAARPSRSRKLRWNGKRWVTRGL